MTPDLHHSAGQATSAKPPIICSNVRNGCASLNPEVVARIERGQADLREVRVRVRKA